MTTTKPHSAGASRGDIPALILAALICLSQHAKAMPCPDLLQAGKPSSAYGWSAAGLENLRQTAKSIGSSALLLMTDNRLIFAYGDLARPLLLRSIRKSLLNALMGIAAQTGKIKLDQKLEDIPLAGFNALSAIEKQARVRELLASRSGIYLPAAGDNQAASKTRPTRGTHNPGQHWHYNNWDFNAAGAIFELQTAAGIFEAFASQIAKPLCMQDFKAGNGRYDYLRNIWRQKLSPFPAYHFWMSARDLARFGQLYLQMGQWSGRQIVPAVWISDSTRPLSSTPEPVFGGYGLMWWVVPGKNLAGKSNGETEQSLPPGSFAAAGYGGQWLIIIPRWRSVIVHLTDTGRWWRPVVLGRDDRIRLFNALLAARLPQAL